MTEQELRDRMFAAPNSSFSQAVMAYACPDAMGPQDWEQKPSPITTTDLVLGALSANRDAMLAAFRVLAPADWADRARSGDPTTVDTLVHLVEYLLAAQP